jgi:hypothetical protein
MAALILLLGGMTTARAAGEVSVADLQAATRALGFLDSIPHDGSVVIGIIFTPQAQGSRESAAQAAAWLNANPGPNKSVFRPKMVSLDNLIQGNDRLDAIILMPGLTADAAAITEAMRRRHLVSISTDPACLDARCCVLMVRADHGVEIVLNTEIAGVVGANFSTVFTMMVKRR